MLRRGGRGRIPLLALPVDASVTNTPQRVAARLLAVTCRRSQDVMIGPVELLIPSGQTTVLLGPSGCGKSTILRLLNGLLAPTSGHVEVLGETLTSEASRTKLRRRMGYVIQEGGLFPHLTARQNATLLPRDAGLSTQECESRLQRYSAIARVETSWYDRLPGELSGGQRQRVALVRALMMEPDLLLLDEPLGALDAMVRFDLQRDLKDALKTLGTTTVLVTHDLAEAAFFGDSLVLLRDGVVVQQGTLRQLEEQPADPFVGRFLQAQSPSMHERGARS